MSSPNPIIRIQDHPPGIDGELFEVVHSFYVAKHEGKYKLKSRAYAQINKRDSKQVVLKKLKEDTESYIKHGRYMDYYYV